MEMIFSLLLSKFGAIGAAIVAVIGLLLNLKWQKHKRAQAEAQAAGLQVTIQHTQDVNQVDADTKDAEDKIHATAQGDSGLVDYFKSGGLLRKPQGGSSKPT